MFLLCSNFWPLDGTVQPHAIVLTIVERFLLAINTFLSPAERGLRPQPLKRMKPAEPLVNKDLCNSSECKKITNTKVNPKIYKKIQHTLKTSFKIATNHLIILTLHYYYIFYLHHFSPWYAIILAVNS